MSARRMLALLALGGLLALGACGDDDPGAAATTEGPTSTGDTTTSGLEQTTTGDSATTELAGEPSDIGPAEGDVLGVVGVAHDDVLNVRSGPGAAQKVIATLE